MDFNHLKKIIEQTPNKKTFLGSSSNFRSDIFRITSALYFYDIYCNNVKNINDIYNVVNYYQLDSNLFEFPFYLTVNFCNYNEDTVNVINQISDDAFIQIVLNEDLDKEKFQILSKINRKNTYVYLSSWIGLDLIEHLTNKFEITEDSSPVIVVEKIDNTTSDRISKLAHKIKEPRFRIEISDINSLQNLYSIIPYISEDGIIVLDDQIFNRNNPNNARDLLLQSDAQELHTYKKLNMSYCGLEYNSLNQIYELEKNLDLIRSRIPSDATDLDIVTYVSLFIINYFKYDYVMYEKINQNMDFDDINLAQFVSRGTGVCRHFAHFTKHLLNSLGIDCEKVDSLGNYQDNVEVEGHSFNVVTINGIMYFLDNTWLAGRIQNGEVESLDQSTDFLTSNAVFGHEEYEDALSDYRCEGYDREEIRKSINRVLNWNQNYKIHPQNLRDLFRKYILKKEKSVEQKIEDAIPRRL